ncbi:TPA: prepilin-type N-terminal cleavage/methylation domain-containing protein, partial [Candidatus Galligastranaerophilus faecipullorum]|nr:prepilin-type N-terminal cleavage/methylation domain-containing protein [Candidatus Galligastranaerophilus faecipullorum]
MKFKHGFTLAELLTAVLVISIIMVALAPVITKRMKDNVSVTTDNKKGLEVYTNPGTYTFDVPIGINTIFLQGAGGGGGGAGSTYVEKEKTFTSSATWTVPVGVNEITLVITGSGGGGGGANAAVNPSASSKNNLLYNDKCLSDEFLAIRGSSDETDLCYTKRNLSYPDVVGAPVLELAPNIAQGETCIKTGMCCWNGNNSGCSAPTSGSAATGCNRAVCTYNGARQVCGAYKARTRAERYAYRLPTGSELNKVVKFVDDWSINAGSSGLQICSHNDNNGCLNGETESPKMPICTIESGCKGAFADYCVEAYIWAADGGGLSFGRHGACSSTVVNTAYTADSAKSVRCARSLNRYTRYSASGGSSGAVLEKTINVLPNDTFEI